MSADKYKNVLLKPSMIIKLNNGKEVTYVYDGKPMTRNEYVKYQKTLSEGIETTFSMRVIASPKQYNRPRSKRT